MRPSVTVTCCSFTHADLTLRRAWVARSMPTSMASSFVLLYGRIVAFAVWSMVLLARVALKLSPTVS